MYAYHIIYNYSYRNLHIQIHLHLLRSVSKIVQLYFYSSSHGKCYIMLYD